MFSWLKWDMAVNRNGSDAHKQMTFDDTYITVESTGLYYIYSQIVLQNKLKTQETSPDSTSTPIFYLHGVYKTGSGGHVERILGGSYTYYPNKNGGSMTTNYIGSPYLLKKGAKIGVKVHDVNELVPSEVSNFFGMHLIS